MTMRKRRSITAVLVSVAATLGLSACVGKPAVEYADTGTAVCPIETNDVTGSVRMGFQVIPGADLYIQDRGLLEACLPNTEVTWTRFPTGQDVVQGFASDSADYGFLGSTPTAKALSAPLDLDVIVPQVNTINRGSEALVAKTARDITELQGQKIATAFSSTSHYSLLNALQNAGLDPGTDVEIVNISPDKLPAAWASDEIEAAFIWNPTLMEIQQTGTTLLDAGDVGDAGAPIFNFTMVDRAHAEANPEILDMWLRLQNWVVDQAENDPAEFIAANAAQTGMTAEETRVQLEGVELVTGPDQPAMLDTAAVALFDTADFLGRQGEVSAQDPAHYDHAVQRDWASNALDTP